MYGKLVYNACKHDTETPCVTDENDLIKMGEHQRFGESYRQNDDAVIRKLASETIKLKYQMSVG